MTVHAEPAPAKINLALHVRGRLPDGRHALETIFAFCCDGDRLEAESSEGLSLTINGPFRDELDASDGNLVLRAARALALSADVAPNAALKLTKNLPVSSGVGGGSADAAAALRLLTLLWGIDPAYATAVAPKLGSDVPACLLSLTARGEGAGDRLRLEDARISGAAVLLVNPCKPLSTREVFERWDGIDRGPLGHWRAGRNDLTDPASAIVPEIAEVLFWLRERNGCDVARMSGSGATCFALFEDEAARDAAAQDVPPNWWCLASVLR